jgi:hypothetical protein
MTVSLERMGKKIMVRDPERKRLADLMAKLPPDAQAVLKEVEKLQQRVRERNAPQLR